MENIAKFTRNVQNMTKSEREAAVALFREIQVPGAKRSLQEAAVNLVDTFLRDKRKRHSNRRTDAERRVTVGARVRRTDAERYRNAAQASGRSVYRFAVDALDAECERAEEKVPPAAAD